MLSFDWPGYIGMGFMVAALKMAEQRRFSAATMNE